MKRLGEWNQYEHRLYLEAMARFKSWEQVSRQVKTRDPVQCRSHHQKMKCKSNRDQANRYCLGKRDAGTQWEPANLKYFSTLPAFLLDKIVDLETENSNCSTVSEDMSPGSISIFSSDAEGFEEFACCQSSEEL